MQFIIFRYIILANVYNHVTTISDTKYFLPSHCPRNSLCSHSLIHILSPWCPPICFLLLQFYFFQSVVPMDSFGTCDSFVSGFCQRNDFERQPCCVYQSFVPFFWQSNALLYKWATVCLSICQSVDIWVVSSLDQIMNKVAKNIAYRFVCGLSSPFGNFCLSNFLYHYLRVFAIYFYQLWIDKKYSCLSNILSTPIYSSL